MVDIQSATAEIRREIKKNIEDRRKKTQGKDIMSASATQGGHRKTSIVILFHFSSLMSSIGEVVQWEISDRNVPYLII